MNYMLPFCTSPEGTRHTCHDIKVPPPELLSSFHQPASAEDLEELRIFNGMEEPARSIEFERLSRILRDARYLEIEPRDVRLIRALKAFAAGAAQTELVSDAKKPRRPLGHSIMGAIGLARRVKSLEADTAFKARVMSLPYKGPSSERKNQEDT